MLSNLLTNVTVRVREISSLPQLEGTLVALGEESLLNLGNKLKQRDGLRLDNLGTLLIITVRK